MSLFASGWGGSGMASKTRLQPLFLSEQDISAPLPDGWRFLRFEDAAQAIPVGKKFENKTVVPVGKVPVIDQSVDGVIGFHNETPGVLAEPSRPVFTFANHTCEMRWMLHPFSCIQNVFAFRGAPGVDTRFLYYAALGRVVLEEYKGHAPIFRSMLVPVPESTDEQKSIAETLAALDDKIALLWETNATLEAIAQALFKSWFVNFDPVRAKAEGRDPEGVPPEVADLFPTEFEDSKLGAIPKGWRIRPWGELITLEYGKALRGYRESKGTIPVYGTNGLIGFHDEAHCAHPGIVVGRKGAYRGIHFSDKPFCVIDTAFFMENREEISWRWAYFEARRFDLNAMDSGSAIPSTDRNLFYQIPICAPPLKIQRAFEHLLASVWEKQSANSQEAGILADLRDTLLPRLMSGRLRIPLAELAKVSS